MTDEASIASAVAAPKPQFYLRTSKSLSSWKILQRGRGAKVFMQLSQCKGADKALATHFVNLACNGTSKAHLLQLYKQREKRFKDADVVHERNQGQLRKEPCDGSSSS